MVKKEGYEIKKTYPSSVLKKNPNIIKDLTPVPEGKKHIENLLKTRNLEYKKEFMFDKTRKYRADYYVPSLNLLIEYEGIFSETSRHTFYTGYTEDANKYNLACCNGYRVFRFTAGNYDMFGSFLNLLIDNDKGRISV